MDFTTKLELQQALHEAARSSPRTGNWSTPDEVQKFTDAKVTASGLKELVHEGAAVQKGSASLFKPGDAAGAGAELGIKGMGPRRGPGKGPRKGPGKDPGKDPGRRQPDPTTYYMAPPNSGGGRRRGGEEPSAANNWGKAREGRRKGKGKSSARKDLQNTLGRGIGTMILGVPTGGVPTPTSGYSPTPTMFQTGPMAL